MAKTFVKNFTIVIGGTDYAAVAKGRSIPVQVDDLDTTNGDSGEWKERIGGLKSWECTVQLVRDADLSGLDAAMFAAIGTSVTVTTKLTDAATSAANPIYSGSAIVMGWDPFPGSVGELLAGELKLAGTGALTRATS